MKIHDLTFPTNVDLHSFDSREALSDKLSKLIQIQLSDAIDQSGKANLAVSGGSTPVELFRQLSQSNIDWQNVTISLVDDRWLEPGHKDSNEKLVHENLLQNAAQHAQFTGFWQSNLNAEEAVNQYNQQLAINDSDLTVTILGMGNDGHTASLFPCSAELDDALNSERNAEVTHPTTANYTRVTLTPKRLLNSQLRILHLHGQDKLETLAKALASNNPKEMPISLFLQNPLSIYWAP